ncbi:helix-turn-helix domain-containing protein [Streptomyces sp. NPDC048639]|uniref:helix-turn-helix domain-containing protein n=1 Tax=Streptomyces sp. NPDC048639 TaxID=3365581 RepID=UPI003720DB04
MTKQYQGVAHMAGANSTCEGVHCRKASASGAVRHGERPLLGTRLCSSCLGAMARTLTSLPALHEECGRVLGGSGQRRLERSPGRTTPGMPLNTAAVEAREAMMRVLASWSGLVVDERGTSVPRRDVRVLAAFLLRHVDWLAGHSAVAELTAELERLLAFAGRVVEPPQVQRMVIGACAREGCGGTLSTYAGPRRNGPEDTRIVCTAEPDHNWAMHEWVSLGRRSPVAGSPKATDGRPAAGRTLWLRATDIAALWQVPRGTVYRLASEHAWRRGSRAGKTYYHAEDVERSLAGRGRGPRAEVAVG